MWAELVKTPLFGIGLTLVVYLLAQTLYRRVNSVWANPVLLAIVAIILLLKGSDIEYRDYARGGDMILFLLGPSVVALAVPLYQRREEIWKRKRLILAGIFAGSLASIISACGLAWLLGGSREVILSLAPKSVTTPIAISIVDKLGGIAPLTAALVVLTGCLGQERAEGDHGHKSEDRRHGKGTRERQETHHRDLRERESRKAKTNSGQFCRF